MKKLLSSLIVLLLLVSCCLIAAFPTSATDINYDDFLIVDGIIYEYTGTASELVIPSVDEEGNPITEIGEAACSGNLNLTSLVIPEGIERIEYNAFGLCTNLSEVSLPSTLQFANQSTFRRCPLDTLVIPGSLEIVMPDFAWVSYDLVVSTGVKEIRPGAFYGGFKKVVFPKSVEIIGACFHGGLAQVKGGIREKNVYVLNPDCELGVIKEDKYISFVNDLFTTPEMYEVQLIDEKIQPLTFAYQGADVEFNVYGLDGSGVEDYVNTYMKGKMGSDRFEVNFKGLSQSEIDKLESENEAKSIKSTVTSDDDDDTSSDATSSDTGSNTDNSNTNTDTNTNNNNTSNDNADNGNSTLLIVVFAILGVLFVLIIAAIVVVVVIMNNKKKKKKAKKAVAVVEEVAEEVADEATEEVTEENGDEE